ncbi:MAG: hypothetical protein OS112_01185 [Methanoregula sp.]|nr:MAG: hypothetical protein OS112_01185 [Methanoregula sp.]
MTVTYKVHIGSFNSQSTLDMYTELSNATWVVTKTDIVEDVPAVTSPLVTKSGSRVRIDGWTLSYVRRQIELNVQLKGTAPDVFQTQDKTIIRVQEWDSGAQPISGTGISKKYQIFVPTPTPETPPPTLVQTQAEVTPEQTTTVTSATPTRKETYTPGPGPALVCGVLALFVVFVAVNRKK